MITVENLKQIRDKNKPAIEFRQENGPDSSKVIVSMGTSGIENGARDVLLALAAEVADKQIHHVIVTQSDASGTPELEPVLSVVRDGQTVKYVRVTPEKALRILHEHAEQGHAVAEYTLDAANAQ